MSRKLVVGLTGSFGAGKSTVGKIFKRLGARKVMDADRLAHEVFGSNHPMGRKIKSLFQIKGVLTRNKIAGEVFQKSAKRKQLEALIHPYVLKRLKEALGRIASGIVVLEVPLLFESRFDKLCDVTVSISAPRRLVEKRLAQRGFNPEQVRKRLNAQMPQSEKKKRSDFFIHNSGSKKLLTQRTKSVWENLERISNRAH